MTDPFFMPLTIARVTSFGAAAPGMSTAPTSRSARATARAIAIGFDMSVATCPPKTSSMYCIFVTLRSRIVTRAPMPSAILAAFIPTTPPPMMITSAGGTPGTPPRSTPRPPLTRSR